MPERSQTCITKENNGLYNGISEIRETYRISDLGQRNVDLFKAITTDSCRYIANSAR